MPIQKLIPAWIVIVVVSLTALAQDRVLLRIVKAEDERRWDTDLKELLASPNAAVRKRAALAAGRIGNEDSVQALSGLLQDKDADVRAMAAFALGEVEAASGAAPLLAALKDGSVSVRARAIEALGKIAGALPKEQEARRLELGAAILEAIKTPSSDQLTAILGLTAVLRSRPANAGPTVAQFLSHSDARVRADAGNTLARLRLNAGNEQLRKLLDSDTEAIVRANAARVLGITEDKASFDSLLKHATDDFDSRVRVSAIRSLASLKDPRAAEPLLKRGNTENLSTNEALEIATTLGRLLAVKEDQAALTWLNKLSQTLNRTAPEVEIALVRISPGAYLRGLGTPAKESVQRSILLNWHSASGIAAGLGEIAAMPELIKTKLDVASIAESLLRAMLDYKNSSVKVETLVAVHSEYAIPDVLRALAAFKPQDLADVALKHLNESDVIVRGTAADLLGDLPPNERYTQALAAALARTPNDPLNDAALSIINA